MIDLLGDILHPPMLPLVKVPCILVAMVGLQVAVTPPHPPPKEDEKAASTKLEVALKQRSAPLMVKTIAWGTALAEVAVILAKHAPSLPISQHIISNLVLVGGGADGIRPSIFFFVGASLTALGGFIRYRCYKALGSMFTYEMSIRKDHILVTTGPYNVVRHPGYAGILITVTGMLLMHASKGSWIRESGVMKTLAMKGITLINLAVVTTITTGLLKRMYKEDEALHELSPTEWEVWARRVPCKLIPWIF